MSRVPLTLLWPILLLALGCGTQSNVSPPADAAATPAAPRAALDSTNGKASTPSSHQAVAAPAAFGRQSTHKQDLADAHLQVGSQPLADVPPDSVQTRASVDEARIASFGIRKLSGEHLTLYTDLPDSPAVDQLVTAFDQAYPQWCDYFKVPALRDQPWRATACVMSDKERFVNAGLLPHNLPSFRHGYFRGDRFWVYDQPDDYYRRHLLLHEGTHAFMDAVLGSCGPPWYKEGMAELLATHAIEGGRVRLNYLPVDADDVPGWGRVRLVHDARGAGRSLKIDDILAFETGAHLDIEPYAWCWAAAAFLDGHPAYRERFRQLSARAGSADFNGLLRKEFAADWPHLGEEWQLFAAHLDYGYDLPRAAIDFRPGEPLPTGGAKVEVAADRGWQSTGITLAAGKTYRLRATGRYQVAAAPRPWLSEPSGVTIRYWEGQPLGALLAAVHPEPFDPRQESALLAPIVVGNETTIQPTATGTLYLRINDSDAELADNAGSLEVQVTEERKPNS